MVKRLLACMLLAVPCTYADWLDDIALFVENKKLDQLKAVNLIKTYVNKSKAKIERLEKKLEANDEDGFWATLRGNTYQVQWAAAKMSLRYHKKVFEFIKNLPKNQRDRENLIHYLALLKCNELELIALRERYNRASSWTDTFKLGGLIAAKELQIRGRKALIKSTFLV